MTFSEWLDAERGRLTDLATRFDVSPSSVHQWKTNGVPRDRMLEVREITGGSVTLEEMIARPVADESAQAAANH